MGEDRGIERNVGGYGGRKGREREKFLLPSRIDEVQCLLCQFLKTSLGEPS